MAWEDTEKLLRAGGADGMADFLIVAEEIFVNGGDKPFTEWSYTAFQMLPEFEQAILLAALIKDSIKLRNSDAKEKIPR